MAQESKPLNKPTDAELVGVLRACRTALRMRDQSEFEVRVLGAVNAALAAFTSTDQRHSEIVEGKQS